MNRNSNVWWFPLARRVLGWGAAGALLWALPVAIPMASLILFIVQHPTPPVPEAERGLLELDDSALLGILLWLGGGSSFILAIMGGLVGIVTGIYAPVNDAKNPFKSRFFRSVGRQTFWFTASTSLLCAFTSNFLFMIIHLVPFMWVFLIWFLSSVALFGLNLWRAVNRALDAATASDYNA